MKLNIQDTFNVELPADKNLNNVPRQVYESFYSFVEPMIPINPSLVHVSNEMADNLGISAQDILSKDFINTFSGAKIMEGSSPYAMCYGGHQFGHWAGQLGDGRAINLGEIVHQNKRWALQLKGSGKTPYSRTADGLAVLRSSVREHLCSEAMYHLGVPTTRSLSLSLTGNEVLRDMMYNGNQAMEKGAVVCRAAESFVRFGNFQIFASRNDTENLKKLADYTIQHFFPEVVSTGKQSYIDFFEAVANRTCDMIVAWQRVGFVHGVMNTDNMSILGLTIDYGPYGWLEGYDPNWTPNTTDKEHARYRYGNQPSISMWNLLQLANALYPLVDEAEPLEAILKNYQEAYTTKHHNMMLGKLGLQLNQEHNSDLIAALEAVLEVVETDMTIFYRLLSRVKKATNAMEVFDLIKPAFYNEEALDQHVLARWTTWIEKYLERLSQESITDEARQEAMNLVNPKYVLRNYMAQEAIDAANNGDYSVINELYELLKQPYTEQPEMEKWFAKRPEWARNKVGCSMLSCSS